MLAYLLAHYGWFLSIGIGIWFVVDKALQLLGRIEQHLAHIRDLLAAQFPDQRSAEDKLISRVTLLIEQNKKIQAIKIVRQTRGCTLMEAKRFVDDLASKIS